MGIALVVGINWFLLFSYVLIWGALVALILYSVAWIKNKLSKHPNTKKNPPKTGTTIEHE